jgi:hypothetical protein
MKRLLQAEMVDDEDGVRISHSQPSHLLEASGRSEVHRQGMLCCRGESPVDSWIRGIGRRFLIEENPDADRSLCSRPLCDDIRDPGIRGVDRFDQSEPRRMGGVGLDRVTRVVAIQTERRHQDRRIDADSIHCQHHLIASDVIWAGYMSRPGAARMARTNGRAGPVRVLRRTMNIGRLDGAPIVL